MASAWRNPYIDRASASNITSAWGKTKTYSVLLARAGFGVVFHALKSAVFERLGASVSAAFLDSLTRTLLELYPQIGAYGP